jgi:cytochrome c biogenesis protein CcmG, thiol:disulfide interchange protein DsbE
VIFRNPIAVPSYKLTPLLVLAILFTFPIAAFASPGSLLHKPAPRFVRTSLDGRPFDLAALKGQVILLTFWATWCEPCQEEMPRFIDWQTSLGPHGLQIVAVSMDDDTATVRALTAQHGVNYPVVMGDAKLARQYGGILGLPVTFLIDRRGRVAAMFKSETDLNTMERTLRRLLDAR